MITLSHLRRSVGLRLELQAVRKHRSRLGRRVAPRYTEYLETCRAQFSGDGETSPEMLYSAFDKVNSLGRLQTAHVFSTQKLDPRNPGFDRVDW